MDVERFCQITAEGLLLRGCFESPGEHDIPQVKITAYCQARQSRDRLGMCISAYTAPLNWSQMNRANQSIIFQWVNYPYDDLRTFKPALAEMIGDWQKQELPWIRSDAAVICTLLNGEWTDVPVLTYLPHTVNLHALLMSNETSPYWAHHIARVTRTHLGIMIDNLLKTEAVAPSRL
jgi:hypothetical protein